MFLWIVWITEGPAVRRDLTVFTNNYIVSTIVLVENFAGFIFLILNNLKIIAGLSHYFLSEHDVHAYKSYLYKKTMAIKTGQQAPEFTLYNSEKNPVSLSDFKGKKNVLLLFFPMAFTSVCTAELCTVRDEIRNYENEHVQVLGISVDSVFTLAKYKEDQQFNYPLLSDFNKEVSEDYGCIYESFTNMALKGVSKRSAFIIDKQGVIQYAEILENAGEVPDFNAIKEHISRLSI